MKIKIELQNIGLHRKQFWGVSMWILNKKCEQVMKVVFITKCCLIICLTNIRSTPKIHYSQCKCWHILRERERVRKGGREGERGERESVWVCVLLHPTRHLVISLSDKLSTICHEVRNHPPTYTHKHMHTQLDIAYVCACVLVS